MYALQVFNSLFDYEKENEKADECDIVILLLTSPWIYMIVTALTNCQRNIFFLFSGP